MTLSCDSLSAAAPRGISLSPHTVAAANKKLTALMYSAISTELPLNDGATVVMAEAKSERIVKRIAATGAVP